MAVADSTASKICRKCGALFYSGACKACAKRYAKIYRAANAIKMRAYQAARYKAMADILNAASKAWRDDNPNRMREIYSARKARYAADPAKRRAARDSSKAWSLAHPGRMKEIEAAWREAHPDNGRIKSQNRRARKRKNGGQLSSDISEKLFKLQKGRCACCGKSLGTNYHLDHIVPLARGGANEDSNMQLLTWLCNNQKFTKDPLEFMQSRGFLL